MLMPHVTVSGRIMDNANRPEPDRADFPSNAPLAERATFLLKYAVLAPSSHNSQPWQFAVADDEIRVYADESRQLTVADPDGRELYLSVGCALENLVIAAEQFGLGATVTYVSETANRRADEATIRHVATVRLDPDAPAKTDQDSALFDAITERRTNHHPFQATPVPESILEQFEDDATTAGVGLELITDATRKEEVAALQTRADEHQFADPEYRAELGYWIGSGALGATWLAARVGQLAVRHLDLGDREGRKNSKLVTSAPVTAVLTARSDGLETRLDVGRVFEQLALTATSEGLAIHPMSQILEVDALRDDLAALLDLEESTPMHLFRLGYAEPDTTRTPRRSLEDVTT